MEEKSSNNHRVEKKLTKHNHRVVSQAMQLLAASEFDTMHNEHVQVPGAMEGAFVPAAAQSKLFTMGAAAADQLNPFDNEVVSRDAEKSKTGSEATG